MKSFKRIINILILAALLAVGVFIYKFILVYQMENKILKQVIARLEADSRVAEVLVTGVNYDEVQKRAFTTIKFLEYGVDGKPLPAKYFTFSGNIIQFQALVIRFEDIYVRQADKLKGKSAYIFWKAFMLDGKNTQEYVINEAKQTPAGYKIEGAPQPFEDRLWRNFWLYALNPDRAKSSGVKNAQIEAPGTMFIPGYIYTLRIEHDGGLRIEGKPLPKILEGETIPK